MRLCCCTSFIDCFHLAYLPFHSGYLRGVEIIDQTSFTYTGKAQSFLWSNRGFKMHFPDNAFPPEVNQCRIHVKVSLFGQFHFPKDTELVSGQYWIATRHIFVKPVTVEIQHCALEDPQQQSTLTYIVAKCSEEELPYQFLTLEGGVFSPCSQYGSISLAQFSGLAIASRPRFHLLQISRKVHCTRRNYCCKLYYSSSGTCSWEIYFVIMWDLDLHNAVSIHWTLSASQCM